MDKGTNTHCQVCGRLIQAKTGLIAHHGYKRPGDGWQTASCFGAKYRPYEVACDALPPAIKSVATHIARVEAALKVHRKSPPPGMLVPPRGAWNDVSTRSVLRPASFDPAKPDYMPDSYTTLYLRARTRLEQDIKASKATKEFFEQRLAEWKPPA